MISPCPYPTVATDGTAKDGFILGLPSVCIKCKKDFCAQLHQKDCGVLRHFVCPRGVSCFAVRIGRVGVVVCGVLDLAINRSCPPATKRALRLYKVRQEQIQAWAQQVDDWQDIYRDRQAGEGASATRAMLHDVKTMASAMMRACESVVESLPGETDAEKFEQADPQQVKIIKAGRLMASCFRMMDIYVNPLSATYGRRRQVPVYRMIHMMVRIFEDMARAKGVFIDIAGPSHNSAWVYDSFDVLPMVLLDNAIKYSQPRHAVHVTVRDIGGDVALHVDSYGPPIPPSERTRIFEKGYRTEAAKALESSGSGLGLYVATIVAEAHATKVEYIPVAQERGNINRFRCLIPGGSKL